MTPFDFSFILIKSISISDGISPILNIVLSLRFSAFKCVEYKIVAEIIKRIRINFLLNMIFFIFKDASCLLITVDNILIDDYI
ncbi:MAG: hypothetical protein BWY78_01353 [Alphaproteobacteria bacterium ADurb.Bin438]|nr:MAG: hypothetical protein BWY78_01353 [Alphaproteobacteria bacterium ADurb.Bin438]